MSNIIVRLRYQDCKNVQNGVSNWAKYASKKEGADGHSINDDSTYYDLISKQFNIETHTYDNDVSYLWNKNGDAKLEDFISKINTEKGFVWDMVISFKENFCFENGLLNKKNFFELTKQIIPKFINDSSMSTTNTNWLSALHLNTKNPHLHICLYESDSKIKKGVLDKQALKKMKSNIASFLIDYKNFYKKRDNYFLGLTSDIRNKNYLSVVKETFFTSSERRTLNNKLFALYEKLPDKGRLQYNSKSLKNLKSELKEIIKYILTHSSIKYDYEQYYNLLLNHQKELKKVYGDTKDNNYIDNQLERLYSKIGNDILTEFKIYKDKPFMENQREFLMTKIMDIKFKSYSKTEKSIIDAGRGLYRLGLLVGLDDYNMIILFDNWISRSGYNKNSSFFIEKYKDEDHFTLTKDDFYLIIKKLGYNNERYFKAKSKHFYQMVKYKMIYNQSKKYLSYALKEEREENIDKENYYNI